jgi:hypothetical protein
MQIKKTILFRALAAILLLTAPASFALAAAVAPRESRPLVFVITGESNSGGIGTNADASPKERSPRTGVQIMNLTDGNFGFENLQLGVNNLRDHHRLEKFYTTHHGLENGLANAVDANAFPGHKRIYLIKTGHGGSRISQWSESHSSGFWKKFTQRTEAAKRQLPDHPQWVVWFSLGINDGIDRAPINRWKQNVQDHLQRIRTQLPAAIIVMTQFQSMGYPKINDAIAKIAKDDPRVVAVDSTGASLRDKNPWDYAGLKTVAGRMIAATQRQIESASRTPQRQETSKKTRSSNRP